MTTITSRKRVLTFLERSQAATAVEVARALNITPANARHHLSQLVADGLVRVTGQRLLAGRGRPTRVYRLGASAEGESMTHVLDATLDFLGENLGEAFHLQWAAFVAARLAGPGVLARSAHITRRLAAAIDRLNTLKYHARWEAHAAGPRVILGECPYAPVIDAHPDLCRMDAELLLRLTGQPVAQAAKLEPNERGLPFCLFLIES